MSNTTVIVAGATGALGKKIIRELTAHDARVRALVRPTSSPDDVAVLRSLGAIVTVHDPDRPSTLASACEGADCVLSAVAGLHDVVVEAQMRLLDAAVAAGATRFIPSDFSIDFYRTPDGRNRNLDLRREFAARLEARPIRATSILNGIFSEYMFSPAPFVVPAIRRSIYFGGGQAIDVTSMDDTAAYTAMAALDAGSPRFLRIAGNVLTPDGLAAEATAAFGKRFGTLRAGPLWALRPLIAAARALDGGRALYPAFQGMQYAYDMMSGEAKLEPLDNDRYPGMRWTPLRETLAAGPPRFMGNG